MFIGKILGLRLIKGTPVFISQHCKTKKKLSKMTVQHSSGKVKLLLDQTSSELSEHVCLNLSDRGTQ